MMFQNIKKVALFGMILPSAMSVNTAQAMREGDPEDTFYFPRTNIVQPREKGHFYIRTLGGLDYISPILQEGATVSDLKEKVRTAWATHTGQNSEDVDLSLVGPESVVGGFSPKVIEYNDGDKLVNNTPTISVIFKRTQSMR